MTKPLEGYAITAHEAFVRALQLGDSSTAIAAKAQLTYEEWFPEVARDEPLVSFAIDPEGELFFWQTEEAAAALRRFRTETHS